MVKEDLSTHHEFMGTEAHYRITLHKGDDAKEFVVQIGTERRKHVTLLSEPRELNFFAFLVDGVYYSGEIIESNDERITISIASEKFDLVKVKRAIPRSATPSPITDAKRASAEENAIISLIPGKVISLKTKIGDHVRIGDTLVILESMKMEAVIRTDREGIVKEFRVKVGDTVKPGDLLLVLA